MASVLDSILDAVVLLIQGRGTGLDNSQIVKRALPTAEEDIDTLPIVVVCPLDDGEEDEVHDFEGQRHVVYPVQVAYITGTNRTRKVDTAELTLRQKIRKGFETALLTGVAEVWDVDIDPEAPIDRTLLNQAYHYAGFVARFHCTESNT